MLDPAQKPVSTFQVDHFVFRDQLEVGQTAQRIERIRFLEESVPRAVNELKRLHDELDFPDPAATEFHIASEPTVADDVTFDPRFNVRDLAQQIGRRTLWIDERLKRSEE